MTDSQKESLDQLSIIECPHRKYMNGIYICLIHDVPCQYILNNEELICIAKQCREEE